MTEPEITLQPLREEDSATLFDWINTRSLVLSNAPYKPVDSRSHQEWFEDIRRRSDVTIFAIREADRLVGTCQLHSIDRVNRSAELQIRIAAGDDRGRGIGTKVVQQLVDFGFRDLNLHRIFLHVFADNKPAIRIYLRSGFKEEGRLRDAVFVDGRFVDVIVMGRLRTEC